MVHAATDLRPEHDDAQIRMFLLNHADAIEAGFRNASDGDFDNTQVLWLYLNVSLLRQVTDPAGQAQDPCMEMAFASLLLDVATFDILIREGAQDYASLARVIQRMETSADRRGIPEISYHLVAHLVPISRCSWSARPMRRCETSSYCR